MDHMRQQPSGTRSTSRKCYRGHKPLDLLELEAAADDLLNIPEQEPGNPKTKYVFMTTQLADGWIASDQTGAFPRVSNRGNKHICVFYIFDANFIKGIPIK